MWPVQSFTLSPALVVGEAVHVQRNDLGKEWQKMVINLKWFVAWRK